MEELAGHRDVKGVGMGGDVPLLCLLDSMQIMKSRYISCIYRKIARL